MGKASSRRARWTAAVERARAAIDELEAVREELADLQADYEAWRDGMPDNLQDSPTGQALEAVCDVNLDELLAAEDVVAELEAITLPQGFGRD